ncbi:5-oxoprolinase subunit PxpB [Propionivibrio dicarboxylicus]|uniref:Sensor histidine kinase inhibitor, KipI family n=1 Tax=Propionivibrio dicarboxylicus TaxID=83767 RepID=A0A1G7YAE9_9RHOO|nr:5-oxoprolinase subunit PxpB [Propionivibrio dicarboxylicus]SDG93316.1 sensor histidine kinase inhibitor, KipI family [Propionivibrio dicarboxylicus]
MTSEMSQEKAVRLLPLGDTAWTVEFGDRIDPALHARVIGLLDALETARGRGECGAVVDVVPTYRSLTVHYDPQRGDGEALGRTLVALAQSAGAVRREGRRWCIPVCFDDDLAPDLNDLAATKGLTRAAVIEKMTSTCFEVYMIGFMPGFPYMGGLPAELEMPRLASPRKAVPARSVAVAGSMCAVYPWESPGGWRLLGRTPMPMFSAADETAPALLASGDRVMWRAIDRAEFDAMEAAAQRGEIARDSLLVQEGRP